MQCSWPRSRSREQPQDVKEPEEAAKNDSTVLQEFVVGHMMCYTDTPWERKWVLKWHRYCHRDGFLESPHLISRPFIRQFLNCLSRKLQHAMCNQLDGKISQLPYFRGRWESIKRNESLKKQNNAWVLGTKFVCSIVLRLVHGWALTSIQRYRKWYPWCLSAG